MERPKTTIDLLGHYCYNSINQIIKHEVIVISCKYTKFNSCRWCALSSDPDMFDGVCLLREAVDGREYAIDELKERRLQDGIKRQFNIEI